MKEFVKIAGLTDQVQLASIRGSGHHIEKYQKCELVTMHTGRRSFATNAYLQGDPTISIIKITGHRTEKSFLKYIKFSQEENANKLSDHAFFN